jgi:hypothetical protein
MTQPPGGSDEWWKDSQLVDALSEAVDRAGWRGLTVGSFGVRVATEEDGQMTIGGMCASRISSVRRDKYGFEIYLCGPIGAFDVFIRKENLHFLPITENKADITDIRKQIKEFGDQLRLGLLKR